jgi:GT2 family glycosyltransferase
MPDLRYVQFVDGDCEVIDGWLESAIKVLDDHSDIGAVCGFRRERFPETSVYNWLCSREWEGPTGDIGACGGDVMIRARAFEAMGGYRDDIIAGEEPELCVRLRGAGWRIWRIDTDMTLHDAAMTRFSQWWRRAMRGGYSYALGVHLHGAPPERHFVWQSRRAWLWGFWLPLVCLATSLILWPWGWLVWLVYPLQVLRQTVRNSGTLGERATLAFFQTLARFPEALGQIEFMRDRLFDRQTPLIEYK